MKFYTLIFLFSIGLSVSVYGQDVEFGIKTGVNFSKFGKDVDRDGRTSVFIGGFADFEIKEQLHIQPEVLYSSEGSEDLEANFLRFMGIGKYYPIAGEGFSLESGPYFGFRISGDDIVEDNSKSFDFGLSFGAGYEIKDIGLVFGARYNVGIANLGENGIDTNMNTFQLTVGYKFPG